MGTFKYYIFRILSKILGQKWLIKYYKNLGIEIGDNTHIFSRIISSEPYMIKIGSNVTISTGVTLLTHDASIGPVMGRDKYSDIVGPITIGDNCFIGASSIILCGVSIPNNCIVAAGSVVTKTIMAPKDIVKANDECEGFIIGGNPAKYICSISKFIQKRENNFLKMHGVSLTERKSIIFNNKDKWIKK